MTQASAAMDIYATAMQRGDPEHQLLQAGQGLRSARRVEPASDIVDELVRDAGSLIDRLRGER
jgi:NAD(P)H-dependent flavin oxidoreductase YrpB (nitropropane dioxygenase family)